MLNSEILALKKKELELLKASKQFESELPHLYSMKLYKWARQFYDSTNKVNLVCAANQISKSSTLIRRAIANATDPERWETIYGKKPGMLWYFYPDSGTLEKEWEMKWKKEWMPRGSQEISQKWGWKLEKKRGVPYCIHWNTGVKQYFLYYTQDVSNMQAGSVDEVFCDEEMPMAFYDEIMFRLTATDGIFSAGFTPTLNQLFWKQAIETEKILEGALKLQVSMYDCLKYEDGSPSTAFTVEKIERIKRKCKNETEIQRRVYGRFVSETGRTYYAFDFDKHFCHRKPVANLLIYASVDYGSGGAMGHPSAITFIGLESNYQKGYVIAAWRGDGIQTTAGDVFNRYQEMSLSLPPVVQRVYDPAAKDFAVIAERNGVTFMKADKSRDAGEENLNTLFKHGMLELFSDDIEIEKLGVELMHIMKDNQAGGHKADDDLADSLRYNCLLIPWDFSIIDERAQAEILEREEVKAKPMTEAEFMAQQIEERRGNYKDPRKDESAGWAELEEEFDYWNEQYG